ncbi:hypothetical protein ACI3K5_05065 [Streptomyces sp. MPA0124]|uniref:hypothetical protein n=1 Tax=Streptomyces sp. MPA0124 TaxID=3378069 RepID=UPI003852D929
MTRSSAPGGRWPNGADCAYIADVADVAAHPDRQGQGLGSDIIRRLPELARDHKKLLRYASPCTEPFHRRLGCLPMNTAMAVWADPDRAIDVGLLRRES